MACALDISFGFVLLCSLQGWKVKRIDWRLDAPFRENFADLFFASCLRSALLYGFGQLAISLGTPSSKNNADEQNGSKAKRVPKEHEEIRLPLLVGEDGEDYDQAVGAWVIDPTVRKKLPLQPGEINAVDPEARDKVCFSGRWRAGQGKGGQGRAVQIRAGSVGRGRAWRGGVGRAGT